MLLSPTSGDPSARQLQGSSALYQRDRPSHVPHIYRQPPYGSCGGRWYSRLWADSP